MKKDHEDQLQRLKKLKDEEIDAVTSVTSQTRWVIYTFNLFKQSFFWTNGFADCFEPYQHPTVQIERLC